jgi:hypothetical protein
MGKLIERAKDSKNDELSIAEVFGEQGRELPQKALMRHRKRHCYDYEYCRYDYCRYPDYCPA